MREIRPYGSEGGGNQVNGSSLPLSRQMSPDRRWMDGSAKRGYSAQVPASQATNGGGWETESSRMTSSRLDLWAQFGDGLPSPDGLLAAALAVAVLLILGWLLAVPLRRQLRERASLLSSLQSELADRRRAEDALRESEVFYHSLVESLPQSILRKDLDGRFTFANTRFCNALGLPLERHRRQDGLRLLPPQPGREIPPR